MSLCLRGTCWATILLAILAPQQADAAGLATDNQVETALAQLEPNHPRLLLKGEALAQLKTLAGSDPTLARYMDDVVRQAGSYLEARPLQYEKIGPRLLHVSRACLERVYALALAWRWTQDRQLADKAVEQLLTVCEFPDWNPSHFLDTAEMSHAVGIGYDWLYYCMDRQVRARIRGALVDKGLRPGLEVYDRGGWWTTSSHNWNQVCNGGMIVGALAVAETDPEYARRIIQAALQSLPKALTTYDPDGAWPEGPGYWSYATHYTAYGIAALQTALGRTFGLLDLQGLRNAGDFPIYTTGPTGLYLNFADCGQFSSRRPMPCMFWLAKTFPDGGIWAWSEHRVLASARALPGHVIWYIPSPKEPPGMYLDRYFGGPVEVAVLASSRTDPNALFVGIKAGYNQVNHGHLDLGNFELDALGVRWARDLGSDNYNLPGYWESGRDGRRWQYYRLRSASHSVPAIDGHDQDPFGKARFIDSGMNTRDPHAVVDLTSAYRPHAEKVLRGLRLVEGRKAVLIQDEFDLPRNARITWAMTTDAAITIDRPNMATLEMDGRRLVARVLEPGSGTFSVASAEQQAPQASNEGVRRLLLDVTAGPGTARIAVLLSPVWPDSGDVKDIPVRPLDQW